MNAACKNVKASFTCNCKPGYYGDGKTCSGKFLKYFIQLFLPLFPTPPFPFSLCLFFVRSFGFLLSYIIKSLLPQLFQNSPQNELRVPLLVISILLIFWTRLFSPPAKSKVTKKKRIDKIRGRYNDLSNLLHIESKVFRVFQKRKKRFLIVARW